ncbi:MAG: cytochrome P450 [Halioglobus sp.]|nr:cytochrome P450 [Halioglobus sp.]
MSELAISEEALEELQPIEVGPLETWRFIRQSYQYPLEHAQELQKRYGNAVMQKIAGRTYVNLYGADAHRLALLNDGEVFSNAKAWNLIIGRIFPNGLMLRDGDDHRYHRRLMQAGFKNKVMQGYFRDMLPQVQEAIAAWPIRPGKSLLAYPLFKRMTLDMAATIFLGMDLGDEADRINQAFETTVAASMPRIPVAIPGTLLWRGIRARKQMCHFFMKQIHSRRHGSGRDMFTLLCQATDEEGNRYTDQEVIDHMIFLMMAAHDTTTSALTSMTYALARHPEWQQRLLDEVVGLGTGPLRYEDLDALQHIEWVMKEALRMYPPLSTLPKYSLKPFEFEGVKIPADAIVVTYPIHTHYMTDYWREPQQFDPLRFSDERLEHKNHPYCWVPFSGGAHMCIGLHFAIMQIKLVMYQMLRSYRWSVPKDYRMPVQQSPISKPRDNLPVFFEHRG